jgi:hypothetical protein
MNKNNKKLKIFFIKRNDGVNYDEYDSAVVVAHTEEEVVNMLRSKHGTDPYGTWRNYNVTVTEVIPDSPRIVIESFNAG